MTTYTVMDDDEAVLVLEAGGHNQPPTSVHAADPYYGSQADLAREMAEAGLPCTSIAAHMGYQAYLVEGDRS